MQLAMNLHEGRGWKLPVYDASLLTKGQGLIWGQDASSTASYNALVACANTTADIFGVLKTVPSAYITTNAQTPILNLAEVQLVKPYRIWKVYYDLTASTDLDVVSSTSTVLTAATADDNQEGGWLYITSGTGAGQLRYIKAANTTADFTVNTAFTVTPDATSDFILIRHQGIPDGGTHLNATFDMILSALQGAGQKMIILENHIQSGAVADQVLDITGNPGLEMDGLNGRSVRFFSYVIFIDTIDAATGM